VSESHTPQTFSANEVISIAERHRRHLFPENISCYAREKEREEIILALALLHQIWRGCEKSFTIRSAKEYPLLSDRKHE